MNCIKCGKQTNNPKFCSKSCSVSYCNAVAPKRKLHKKCKICKIQILSDHSYCKRCWEDNKQIISLIGITKRQDYNPSKHPKICLFCGNVAKRKFCNVRCSTDYKFQQRVNLVDARGYVYADKIFRTGSSISFCKKYLVHKHGPKCALCGLGPNWNGRELIFVLDHINGTPNDWSVNNLRLLCPNCNSQTSTFCGKNKGFGRPHRQPILSQKDLIVV